MHKIQIMVVEDEGIIALGIERKLKRLGYDVPLTVSSGEEALQRVEGIQPDLILMDIMLAGALDGVETAAHIRNRFDIPVVYLTAYGDEKTLERAKITAPYGYILKPFRTKELHAAVEIALYKNTAEKKLKESEQRLATTLNSIGDAVIATDTHSRVTFMNPVAEGLTGWSQTEAQGQDIKQIFITLHKDSRTPDPVLNVLKTRNAVSLSNHTLLRARDGTVRPIENNATPIKDDKDNISGVVLVFRDISARKKAEFELEQRSRQLEASNKELKSFNYSVTHDLRAPLQTIMGFAQLIELNHYDSLNEEVRFYMNDIMAASEHMSTLIDDLLNYSQLGHQAQAIRRQAVPLQALLQNVTHNLAAHISSNEAELKLPLAQELPILHGDPTLLGQIFTNLLGNALIYRRPNAPLQVKVHCQIEDNQALIGVSDNGIGIPLEYQEQIFNIFERLHDREDYPGTGIGLAIVEKAVKLMEGQIWLESVVNEGSTFWVKLPCSPN